MLCFCLVRIIFELGSSDKKKSNWIFFISLTVSSHFWQIIVFFVLIYSLVSGIFRYVFDSDIFLFLLSSLEFYFRRKFWSPLKGLALERNATLFVITKFDVGQREYVEKDFFFCSNLLTRFNPFYNVDILARILIQWFHCNEEAKKHLDVSFESPKSIFFLFCSNYKFSYIEHKGEQRAQRTLTRTKIEEYCKFPLKLIQWNKLIL